MWHVFGATSSDRPGGEPGIAPHAASGMSTVDVGEIAAAADHHVVAACASVAVLVLNWCNEVDTARCLQSVLEVRYPNVVPLLIDNGSPDGSGDRLSARFPEVAYLQTGANLGYTGGNNAGFAWAIERGADYVLVLNNDAELDAECVSNLVALAEATPGVGVVAPKILDREDRTRVWYAGGSLSVSRATGTHWREGELDRSEDDPVPGTRITFATGCCFLITRSALDAVRGFEPSYFAYNEDADLSYRLAQAGFALAYDPRARVYHRGSHDGPSPFQIRMRDRNRRRFARLRLTPVQRVAFDLWFYASRLARWVEYAAAGDRPRAAAIVSGALGPLGSEGV